jgi:hypothetical protein
VVVAVALVAVAVAQVVLERQRILLLQQVRL